MAKIKIHADTMKIQIEGESTDFWSEDLYTKAIKHLIQNADISAWQKNNHLDALTEFSIAILESLDLLLRYNDDSGEENTRTAMENTEETLIWIKEQGRMNEVPVLPKDEEDLEWLENSGKPASE